MWFAYLFAILSPLNQSIAEMETILKDPRTSEKLREGAPIIQILKKQKGYLLVTKDQQMYVKIQYKNGSKIGPTSFDLIFQDPITVGNYENEPLFD